MIGMPITDHHVWGHAYEHDNAIQLKGLPIDEFDQVKGFVVIYKICL
jgi:hypothetical protein